MDQTPLQRATGAATAALVVAAVCTAMFVPPLLDHTTDSVLRIVLTGLTLAMALTLHWVFVGIAAHRAGRSATGWVLLALLLFPIGSLIALLVLGGAARHSPIADGGAAVT